jgi:hypothetical protein
VGYKKDDISIKTVAFQNFPEGININRKHDCQFKRTPQVFNPLRGWGWGLMPVSIDMQVLRTACDPIF